MSPAQDPGACATPLHPGAFLLSNWPGPLFGVPAVFSSSAPFHGRNLGPARELVTGTINQNITGTESRP
jgi:hypothetical protein